jgi:hypothetical protein
MHIPLPVHQTDDHNLVIQRLPFNPAIRGLYEAIGVTVGSGITADYHEWFYYTHLIWPESKKCGLIEKPIEFQKLLLVAGVNSTRLSLQDVVWWTLGGILAKTSAVSRGDDSWSKRYKEMKVPFQRYLVGDTGPPSLAAWVLIMCWAVHVFPDPSGVYAMSEKPMPKVIQWIGRSVFMRILSELAPNYLEYPAGRSLPPLQTYGSRKEAVSTITIPTTAWMQPIRLCPGWPSVAAGGARYLHSVRAFYLDSWKTLRAADRQFWDPYDKGWAPHLIFGRELPAVINHPNIGVRSTWLQPNVSPRPILDIPASEVTRDRIKQCRNAIGIHATLCEYMVTNPIEGRRFYHRLESAQTFLVKLLGRHRDLGHMIEYRQL